MNRALFTLLLAFGILALRSPVAAQEENAGNPVPLVNPEAGDSGQPIFRPTSEDERRVKELQRSALRNIETLRWRRAIRDVQGLITLNPYDASYQLTLGLLYRKENNLVEARSKFNEYLDLGGSEAVGHLMIGESYAAEQDNEKVFEHLRKAAENGMNLLKVVDSYEALKPLRNETEFIKLALQLETYELDLAGLDDPFANRFRHQQDESLDGSEDRGLTRKRQEEILQDAQVYLSRIERALTQENEEQAMKAYKQLLALTEEAERMTVPRLKAEFRTIVDRKEEIEARIEEIRLKYHYGEAQKLIAEMKQAFKNHDYPRVEALQQELVKVAEQMTRINADFQEVADRIYEVGMNWVHRAQIRREFNALTLSIQGIVLDGDYSSAIVNNRLVEVGHKLDELVVLRIEPNQVLFDFRGEQIPLVFRRY